MTAMIASAPMRARNRMESSPAAVDRRYARRSAAISAARGCAAIVHQEDRPGSGGGQAPKQDDPFGDCPFPKVADDHSQLSGDSRESRMIPAGIGATRLAACAGGCAGGEHL